MSSIFGRRRKPKKNKVKFAVGCRILNRLAAMHLSKRHTKHRKDGGYTTALRNTRVYRNEQIRKCKLRLELNNQFGVASYHASGTTL